jgi:hypothetical protein
VDDVPEFVRTKMFDRRELCKSIGIGALEIGNKVVQLLTH